MFKMSIKKVLQEYEAYVKSFGLFEGFAKGEPGYVTLWSPEELEINNERIQIERNAPGFYAFAGTGADEVLAFNADGAIFLLPLLAINSNSAEKIAESFQQLALTFEL